jgi:gliding motility-associated-like protein
MPQMLSGASETLVFTVRLITGGEITNTAVIQGAETDIDLSDNTFTITPVPVTGEDIFIPNIITPNGDGKNDYFVIRGLDRYPGSTLAVYNRWGNQVYQNKNYDNRWDALGLTESTYFYILKVRTPQGDRDYKGWVEVVR